VASHNSVNIDE